jgi:hypothetical protein
MSQTALVEVGFVKSIRSLLEAPVLCSDAR